MSTASSSLAMQHPHVCDLSSVSKRRQWNAMHDASRRFSNVLDLCHSFRLLSFHWLSGANQGTRATDVAIRAPYGRIF